MSEKQFINYYRCPFDGTEWADVWSCCCNDMCPKCETKDITPYKSKEVIHTKVKRAGSRAGRISSSKTRR
jgi:hypothetical protein